MKRGIRKNLVDHSVAGGSKESQQPKRVEGISDVATYKFAKNRITREDVFTITGDQKEIGRAHV